MRFVPLQDLLNHRPARRIFDMEEVFANPLGLRQIPFQRACGRRVGEILKGKVNLAEQAA